jgi:hypothetical protein
MLFHSTRPGAAPGFAATTATIAAATIAAMILVSPGRAQTAPGAAEPAAGAEAPPPGPSTTGQAPAAEGPAPSSTGQAPPAAAAPAPAPSEQTAGAPPPRKIARPRGQGPTTVAAKVNLRRGPDTNSEIVTTIPAGSAVRVGECEGEWCNVTWNGHSGFAVARNLNLGGSRQAGVYPGRPGQPRGPVGPGGYPDADYDVPGYGPGYYGPPGVVYGGPAYYYGPRVYYYGRPWGWRRHWW